MKRFLLLFLAGSLVAACEEVPTGLADQAGIALGETSTKAGAAGAIAPRSSVTPTSPSSAVAPTNPRLPTTAPPPSYNPKVPTSDTSGESRATITGREAVIQLPSGEGITMVNGKRVGPS